MDLVKQVNEYRNKNELSFKRLATDIGISYPTLKRFLEDETVSLMAYDKIREFMESKEENEFS